MLCFSQNPSKVSKIFLNYPKHWTDCVNGHIFMVTLDIMAETKETYSKHYYNKNRERILAYQKEYYRTKKSTKKRHSHCKRCARNSGGSRRKLQHSYWII